MFARHYDFAEGAFDDFSPQQARRLKDELMRRSAGLCALWPEVLAEIEDRIGRQT